MGMRAGPAQDTSACPYERQRIHSNKHDLKGAWRRLTSSMWLLMLIWGMVTLGALNMPAMSPMASFLASMSLDTSGRSKWGRAKLRDGSSGFLNSSHRGPWGWGGLEGSGAFRGRRAARLGP